MSSLAIGFSVNVSADDSLLPTWIKNTAKFWVDDQISDKEFIDALQYLVEQGILTIPTPEDASFGAGDYTFSLEDRRYFVHVPDSYDGTSTPLVLNLHGGGGDIDAARKQTQMESHSDEHGYVAVFPEGSGLTILGKHVGTWNAGTCCGGAESKNIDDVKFIGKVLDDVESKFAIDSSRIYATGHSNGAMMSYRLACDLSERIAAIAPNAGHDSYGDCNPARQVPVMHFHGTADPVALYDGGHCGGKLGDDGWTCSSVADYAETWAMQNQCGVSTHVIYQNDAAKCIAYDDCSADVVLCTIDGAGHTWPDGSYAVNTNFWKKNVGEISRDINANDQMWNFFQQHALE